MSYTLSHFDGIGVANIHGLVPDVKVQVLHSSGGAPLVPHLRLITATPSRSNLNFYNSLWQEERVGRNTEEAKCNLGGLFDCDGTGHDELGLFVAGEAHLCIPGIELFNKALSLPDPKISISSKIPFKLDLLS